MVDWRAIDMVEHIYQSNRIEDIHGVAEIERSLVAWHFLAGSAVLTHDVIRETQRIVTGGQEDLDPGYRGVYRSECRVNVMVGGYRPPPWQDVAGLMDDWLAGCPKRSPWVNHVYFEGIHPFADGNGRVGRMLMWRQQVLAGGQPRMILSADRQDYYRDLDRHRRIHALSMIEGA